MKELKNVYASCDNIQKKINDIEKKSEFVKEKNIKKKIFSAELTEKKPILQNKKIKKE